jgi:pimeloyl-ACP methyl ester carboxylesterase
MTATPLWFGPSGQFGWLHLPGDGQARAGVVICPAIGTEQLWAHLGGRVLAEQLCQRGLAVLHFDYYGTGHSAGDLRREWPDGGLERSAGEAVDFLLSTGVSQVGAIGFRLGAPVAHALVRSGRCHTLALWDPCLSGATFLREQRALTFIGLSSVLAVDESSAPEPGVSGQVETAGFDYPANAKDDLRRLKFDPELDGVGDQTLVLARRSLKAASRDLLEKQAGRYREIDDTEGMFYGYASAPRTSIDAIVEWFDERTPDATAPVVVPPHQVELTTVDPDTGVTVSERIVALGVNRLFGIVAQPADDDSSELTETAPTVVFLNTAAEPCWGPGRRWVELARSLAGRGRRAVRFDVSGHGDSPARPGQARYTAYQVEAVEDTVDVANTLCPDDPGNVVLVGSCSGAYNSLEAAGLLRARAVCAVNPTLRRPRRRWLSGEIVMPMAPGAIQRPTGYRRVTSRIPEGGWRLLHLLRVERSAAAGLKALSRRSKVLILCGPEDARVLNRKGGWILRALDRSGHVCFVTVPSLDHGLLLVSPQAELHQLVLAQLLDLTGERVGPLRQAG